LVRLAISGNIKVVLEYHFGDCQSIVDHRYYGTEEYLQAAQVKITVKEVNTRRQAIMAPFTDTEARPDESIVELEEVFHLE
jgi:L-rhamnose mutarotase